MSGRDVSGAKYAVAVTPSDSTVFAEPRGIYVGVSGDVAMVFPGKAGAVTFKSLVQGSEHALCPVQIYATGTTATDMLLLY